MTRAKRTLASLLTPERLARLARATRDVVRAYAPPLMWTWRDRHELHRVLSSAAVVARHDEDPEVRAYALAVLAAAGVDPSKVSSPVDCHLSIARVCAAPNPPRSWPCFGGDA